MLILSRKEQEKLTFPNLGIKVHVLRVSGRVVRLGIDAPKDIRVLREEIENITPDNEVKEMGMSREERHAFRNRLNAATLGLQVLQRRVEAGQTDQLEPIIARILENLTELDVRFGALRSSPPSGQPKKRARVLIVEDNANEAQLLAEFLQMSGYETEIVSDGCQALQYLKEHEYPEVLLLDMQMPRLTGQQTIRSIREHSHSTKMKVFGVSGLEQCEAGVEFGSHGVDGWFRKPLDARKLVHDLSRELAYN